jgi:two-component system chemotaxis sensor kinase CheA
VLLLNCTLPVDDLACALAGLQKRLKQHGEILGTVPGYPVCGGGLDCCLLLAGCSPDQVGKLVPAEYQLRMRLVNGAREKPAQAPPRSSPRPPRSAQVVRIDVAQLEDMLGVAKNLLLCKGRLSGLSSLVRQATDGDVAEAVDHAVHDLERGLYRLQRCLTDAAMVPIRHLFQRMARVVRSACRNREKQVRLVTRGGQVALERAVLEQLHEPLLHLLRNAVDHGIESAAARREAGKAAEGTVELEACERSGQIMVTVRDDGRGIDPETIRAQAVRMGLATREELGNPQLYDLLFRPGFSTRSKVSEMSGRGVGLDVVRSRMQGLSGLVEIDSRPGTGTVVTLTLPVRKSIMQVLLVDLGGRSFAVPLESILEVRPLCGAKNSLPAGSDAIVIRERTFSLLDMRHFFGLPAAPDKTASSVVAVALGNRKAGLVVDGLQGRRQAVIRPLEGFLRRIPGLAAVAELDDARPVPMLDVGGLLRDIGRSAIRDENWRSAGDHEPALWPEVMAAPVDAPDTERSAICDVPSGGHQAVADCTTSVASRRFLTFFLAGREYGLDIREIIEIIDTVEFNPLPRAPAALRGIVIWRDEVVPVLDACLEMGIGKTKPERFGKTILCRGGGRNMGILVERLGHMIGEPFEEIPVMAQSSGRDVRQYLAGTILAQGREVALLNMDRLVAFPSRSVKER